MDRIVKCEHQKAANKLLKKLSVSSQGIAAMSKKFFHVAIKLENIECGAANILKQEMLRIGGEAAISRGIVEGERKNSDVILLGDVSKFQVLMERLQYYQTFSLPNVNDRIQVVLKYCPKNQKISLPLTELELAPTKIMGILNVTDDSFSDGGEFISPDKAMAHVYTMLENGADIIDIGGESTRPGAETIDTETELARVLPIIQAIRKTSAIPISIDTTKAIVAEQAIAAGADIINDISALRFDKNMVSVLQRNPQVPVILMHMQGTPQNMQKHPFYEDTIEEILALFKERIAFCERQGIDTKRIIIDPGIGFGKRQIDNLEILNHLYDFHAFQVPVLLGASRKRFLQNIYKAPPQERLDGSLATTALAFENDIQIVRVHDVLNHKRFIQTLQAIKEVS